MKFTNQILKALVAVSVVTMLAVPVMAADQLKDGSNQGGEPKDHSLATPCDGINCDRDGTGDKTNQDFFCKYWPELCE